ncbi:similar to An18g00990 [Aspergillus luchuensis]|nr:similar to An18g00990 [Aspergillus luchuensis]
MRVATLVLVAFSAVALALPTTNNVERAAADANVRQMDELTVAAISK